MKLTHHYNGYIYDYSAFRIDSQKLHYNHNLFQNKANDLKNKETLFQKNLRQFLEGFKQK